MCIIRTNARMHIIYLQDRSTLKRPPAVFGRQIPLLPLRTGECCKANEMVDDTAVPSVSGVKKDVSTAILERKKSPNRLVVGKSLILPANPDLIGMTFRGDFQRSKGPWLLFLGTQLDVRRRTRFAISTFHPTDENLFPLLYLLSNSCR